MLPPGDTTMILLSWKLRLPPGNFGLLLPLRQQAKKGVTVLSGVIDQDCEYEISLLLHNGVIIQHLTWRNSEFSGGTFSAGDLTLTT
nr:putative inactive deoxyuridine 5'-triphosphate nucleotidohydrolase-like protein FLJ16323 isoform X2 [Pan troglodytes]